MFVSQKPVTEIRKLLAWLKAPQVPFKNPDLIRQDRFGWEIHWKEYGKQTIYGWEIDHVWPTSLGGLLAPANEEATHWQCNRKKSNNFIG